MKAIVCHKIGTLEDLVMEDAHLPPVAPGEVKVALHAASVGSARKHDDALQMGQAR